MPPVETAPLLWPVLAIIVSTVVIVTAIVVSVWKVRDGLEARDKAAKAQTAEMLRAALDSREHRAAIREESVEALRAPGGREELRRASREAAAEAFHGLAEPMTKEQAAQRERLDRLALEVTTVRKEHGERLGALQEWRAEATAAISDLPEIRRKVSAVERFVVKVMEILKAAHLVKAEEHES